MRLFVAIEFQDSALRALESVAGELRRSLRDLAPEARIRWVPPERLHLTVRFLGEVTAEAVGALSAVFSSPIPVAPFDLRLGGTGVFPPAGRPRVLWVGVDGGDALVQVEQHVHERLAVCGYRSEARAFAPHVTLARVREAQGLGRRRLAEVLPQGLFATTRVEAITLFQSILASAGSTYRRVCRVPLTGQT